MHKTLNPKETSQVNSDCLEDAGRCFFLITELMLGPSGLYFVVNITGFGLVFALFC